MSNALILLIILSLFLLVISILIYKSSMPDNDKLLALILLLCVFSLVAILNETKRSFTSKGPLQPQNLILSSKFLERFFFELDNNKGGGILNSYISTYLGSGGYLTALKKQDNQNFNSLLDQNPKIALLYGKGGGGKSSVMREITKIRQGEGIGVLYLDCMGLGVTEKQVLELLKIEHLFVLDETIEKLNKNGKTVSIILDNLGPMLECRFCSGFYSIFKKRKANFIFVTNSSLTREIIKTDRNFINKIEIFNFESKNAGKNSTFIAKFNEKLEKEKQIDENSLRECEKEIDLNWRLFDEYFNDNKKYQNFISFCSHKVKEMGNGIFKNQVELSDFLKKLIKLALEEKSNAFPNKFIPYSVLKTLQVENVDALINQALLLNILEIDEGRYRFTQKEIYNFLISQMTLN